MASNSGERVIVLAPVGQDAEAMAVRLGASGFQVAVCTDWIGCCQHLKSGAGVLLFTEEALELPALSDLLDALKAQPPWSELPLVILTTGGESRLSRLLDLTASVAGSVILLERPIGATTLVRSVQVALHSRRRQYQVRDLLQEQQRANRIKDEFLGTISHELRTPLNAILGWATVLTRGEIDDETMARAIDAIQRNARAQAELIEDLLDVSRIISGKIRLDVKPVMTTSVVRAALDSVRPAVDARQIQIETYFDPRANVLSGDESRLRQVIWNLLSNSIKFTPSGGRVMVRVDTDGPMARITVTDTGEGIAKEFLPLVFDRFQQQDSSTTRTHGGLGLGLAITRHLVEMHGGTIKAESEGIGKGATFTVRVPLAVSSFQSLPTSKEHKSRAEKSQHRQAPDLTGVKVLAVDDAEDTRVLLQIVLEQYGAEVTTASSAPEAMEVLSRWKPTVIVCDIGMPGEDGYTFIRKVRETHPEIEDLPAIAFTGYVKPEDKRRALEAGYQLFVPKPIETTQLASVIAELHRDTSSAASSTLANA